MNLKNLAGLFSVLLIVLFISCSDDDNKEVALGKNASLTLKYSEQEFKTSGELLFNKATILVKEVEFESLEQDDDDFEVDFKGLYMVDLLTGNSTPEIPMAYLLSGKYEEVELILDDDIAPNMIISGIVTKNGTSAVEFRFLSDEDFDFEAEAEDNNQDYLFEVIEGETANIVMEFELQEWFVGVDITNGELTEGVVVISENNNRNLYDDIKENIENSKLIVYNN